MNDYLENNELDVSNPAPRCPVILLLDVSGSMNGKPIAELNDGVRQFLRETGEDEAAGMSVELEIITFGGEAQIAAEFSNVFYHQEHLPKFVANGSTPMGEALKIARHELKTRRNLYKNKGISCNTPWVILMTDGEPNDEWRSSAAAMKQQAEEGKIQYIGIEIGKDANHTIMQEIMPLTPGPLALQELKFKEFFRWLTDSLKSVSVNAVSEADEMPFKPVMSWAELSDL